MQSTQFPNKIQLAFANSGTKNTIPVNSQIGVVAGAASFTDGFPPLTFTPLNAGGVPPAGADFNGVLNAITAIQRWQNAGGCFRYDAAFSAAIGGYPKGALLVSSTDGFYWRSIVDNNTTDPDGGSSAGWIASIALQTRQVLLPGTATLNFRDAGKSFIGSSNTPFNITLPLANSVPDGSRISFANMNAGAMTVLRQGTDNINTGGANTSLVLGVGGTLTLESYSVSGQWYVVNSSGIGVDQLWVNLTGSRALATTYTNGAKGILVAANVIAAGIGAMNMTFTVNGVAQPGIVAYSAGAGYVAKDTILVPPNATYSLATGGSATPALSNWFELR